MGSNINDRGRDKFNKFEWLINLLVVVFSTFPFSFRKILFRLFRNLQGLIGIGIRYILLKTIAKEVGSNVSIQPGVYLLNPENISIGNNVSIHPMCYIDGAGGILIGNDVSIAHGTTIMSSSHCYSNASIPIKDQGYIFKKTYIEDNVWIGSKSTILNGVVIQSGTVVGANSVVTKNIERDVIVIGAPAKILKNRY